MSSLPRAIRNPRAAPRDEPYGPARAQVLSAEGFAAAVREVSGWPGYAPTPLVALPALAASLGLAAIHYKDERSRFGLKSFKALGGAYAVANVVRAAADPAQVTVTCATDGNHGRSVAWGAKLFGCRCVIYVHETVSRGRREAIAAYGAQVVEVKGNYDDAVRHADAQAKAHGWTVVSDTSYPGYTRIPTDVMHGYGVMAAEIVRQLPQPPTHVLVQAGVGALAAAMCASFWIAWGPRRPRFIVVEPLEADCVLRSLEAGHPVAVTGALDTIMAGLACGEVSSLAWEILAGGADAAIAVGDAQAKEAVRRLAQVAPAHAVSPAQAGAQSRDPVIIAGETGAAGLAALLACHADPALAAVIGLDASARVLLLGSEGDTDATIYQQIVGRTAEEVLQP